MSPTHKIRLLTVLFLAGLTVFISVARFKVSRGTDFYQYWGVGEAQQWSLALLKSPAAEPEKYATVLNAHATPGADGHFLKANAFRRKLQLNQTPLCYSVFSLMPGDFALALGIYQIIQIILFLAAMLILSVVYFGNWRRLLPWGLLLVVVYGPVASDIRVGNLNIVYFFGFAFLLLLADRFLSQAVARPALVASTVFLSLLVFLALLKPSWALVIILLALYLWVSQKRPVLVPAAAVGTLLGAVFLALPCMQFHSWLVWQDWLHYLRTWNGAAMMAVIPQGNYAPALLFSRLIGINPLTGTLLLAALLSISILIALMLARDKTVTFGRSLVQAALRSLANPHLTVALGVTLTLLLSYFAWRHYYTLSLLPAFWLLSPRHSWWGAKLAGIIAIILTSNIIGRIMRLGFGLTYFITYVMTVIGLMPLWWGVLAAIAVPQTAGARDESGR